MDSSDPSIRYWQILVGATAHDSHCEPSVFSVKVVRHMGEIYFCGRLWKTVAPGGSADDFAYGLILCRGRNGSSLFIRVQTATHAMASKSKPGKIHLQIIEVMKRFPEGVSGGQIRQELEREGLDPGDQTHLDRRKRDLKKWFVIKKDVATVVVNGNNRKVTLYKYAGVRRKVVDEGRISLKERAEVIHGAHGHCQMCGKSVEQHGITLVVHHKKPRDRGVAQAPAASPMTSAEFAVLTRALASGKPLRFLSRP